MKESKQHGKTGKRRRNPQPASILHSALGGYFRLPLAGTAVAVALALLFGPRLGAETPGALRYREAVRPILVHYCYDCHADGMNKGGVALDQFKSDDALVADRDFWWSVLRYLRAGLMPPEKKPRPAPAEQKCVEDWIKTAVLGIDPGNPDPGRAVMRRLNRVEYRNTIRDLMGIDFRTDKEFPPDDTGYGFDNIGAVLTVSPLLLEKYLRAAETIVAAAVPAKEWVPRAQTVGGAEFLALDASGKGDRMTLSTPVSVAHTVQVETAGKYRLALDLKVLVTFNFTPGRCRLMVRTDNHQALTREIAWQDFQDFRFEWDEQWAAGDHPVTLELRPLTSPGEKGATTATVQIAAMEIQGPLDAPHQVRPAGFERFFSHDAPTGVAERRACARAVVNRFARKAFRRPVDDPTLDRLVTIAEKGYQQPGRSFEQGVAQALVAVLASPRFLFRVEETGACGTGRLGSPVDEYALAARLSYFLWATMPDEELLQLADQGKLRHNLESQVKRMVADPRFQGLIENFTGQWLQVRDLEDLAIDERRVLARDNGSEQALDRELEEFRARQAQALLPEQGKPTGPAKPPPVLDPPKVRLDDALRASMRRETEWFFGDIAREDRSVLELIDSDHTFVDESLARFYGLANVTGSGMRRVALPNDSPRGGVLTQAAVLVVTSNPTRTSAVKRGRFILENILGTPSPPPPPDVPGLETAESTFKDHEPTLRETLELHRDKPLCASCHARMDPLGLALENFNALGLWRDHERNQPIDASGKLITGESFHDARDLKRILKNDHRRDFYRCLTEKLLTYALGRGLEYYDVGTVDQIVEGLEKEGGRSSALLLGIIESPAFQERRSL